MHTMVYRFGNKANVKIVGLISLPTGIMPVIESFIEPY